MDKRDPDALADAARSLQLLHRAAIQQGLLDGNDQLLPDGSISPAAAEAIETLIDRLPAAEPPDEAACRRFHAAHLARFTPGERVHLRHVLFAVTPGVDVDALRERAEACLLSLRARCRDMAAEDARFAAAAAELSNCPSGAQGGELGWLGADDCAPEFAREVFAHSEVGVLPRLVATRFGLHVVEVVARRPGQVPPFEAVEPAVRAQLQQQAYANRVREYLRSLVEADDAARGQSGDAGQALREAPATA